MATPGTTSTAGNTELLKAINTLTKAIDNISKSMHSPTSAARARGAQPGNQNAKKDPNKLSKKEADDIYARNKRLARNSDKRLIDLTFELHSFGKTLKEYEKNKKSSIAKYDELIRKQGEHAKSILENNKLSRKFQDRFVSQMEDALKSSKHLSGIKLKAGTTSGRTKEILNIQDSLREVMTLSKRITKKGGGVNERDVGAMMKSLSSAGVTADGMSEQDYKSKLAKLTGKHDAEIAKRKRAIQKHAGSDRPDNGRMQKLQDALAAAEAKAKTEKSAFLNDAAGKINSAVIGVGKFNKSLTTSTLSNLAFSVATEKAYNVIEKLGGQGVSLSSAFAILTKAALKYYQYTTTLANKQMGGLHLQVQRQAVALGASTDATVKYLTDMAHQISQAGLGTVAIQMNEAKAAFGKLGYYGDAALEQATKAALTFEQFGITVKDGKKFGSAMRAYTNEMNEMSKLTGVSVDQQHAMNDSLVKSAESTAMMMRISKEERAVKLMGIITERNRIVQMGASIEQAQEFVKTLQALNNESPEKRIENSMKVMQLAQITGMGADGARLQSLLLKRPEQLTDTERAYLTDTIKELGSRSEQLKGGGMANEMLISRLQESLGGGQLSKALKEGAEVGLAESNRGKIDPNSAEAKKISEDKQMNETVSAIMNLTETVKNVLGLPIVDGFKSVLVAMGVMTAALIGKDKLKSLAGKGIDKIAGKLAGTGGKLAAEGVETAVSGASKAVGQTAAKEAGELALKDGEKAVGKSLLKKIPLVGLIAGLGFGASRAWDGDWTGAAAEVASGAASIVPGAGTAASVAIDVGLAARDINNALNPVNSAVDGSPVESSKGKINVPSSSSVGQESINNQSGNDAARQDPVSELIESVKAGDQAEQNKMDEMIKLLKNLIDAVKPENNGLLTAIRSGAATGISFNDLHDKRTLFSTK